MVSDWYLVLGMIESSAFGLRVSNPFAGGSRREDVLIGLSASLITFKRFTLDGCRREGVS